LGQGEGIVLMTEAHELLSPASVSTVASIGRPAAATVPNRHLKRLVIAGLALSAISTALSVLAVLLASGIVSLDGSSSFERQARAYLLANPQTIVESVNSLEARQKAAAENELTSVLVQRHQEVFNDPASPVAANPQGDVTLVEFFDYNCPYCRKAVPMLDELAKTDKGVRVVLKEYPILGPGSIFAARAALASEKQGKYVSFHKAMMAHKGPVTEGSALELASQVGLDVERLKKDMGDPSIEGAIRRNLALGEALHIAGTPTFITGKQIRPGLVDLDTMKQLLAEARKG
jgi:protein-disulfide isomerase